MAKHTIAIFGTSLDKIDSDQVQLSARYPHVLVAFPFKREMEALVSCGRKDGSYIFRKIIQFLIPDQALWLQSGGAKDFCKAYSDEVSSAYGNLFFTYNIFNIFINR